MKNTIIATINHIKNLRNYVYATGGYTDFLSIIILALHEFDTDEEMDAETAKQIFADVVDGFYIEE